MPVPKMIRARTCHLVPSLGLVLSLTQAQAQNTPDPIAVIAQLTDVVCVDVQDTGSRSESFIRADAEVKLSNVLKKLIGAGASAEYVDKQVDHVNALRDGDLASQIQSVQDCRLTVFSHYSPLVQEWMKQGMMVGAEKAGGSVTVTGDCGGTVVGSDGASVSVTCN
ncbi:hypothetical protein [Primorskyibacter sp. S187A]|uniref:hypothetical protein n=1 Tax=Primorskyibacter sp. S187A TaxID=3415130 RepID=UPI003C7C8BFC